MEQRFAGKKFAGAFSGGLDSCSIVKWLSMQGAEVYSFTVDLGQPDEVDMEDVQKRMLASGAKEAIIIPGQDLLAFAACKAMQAQAWYEGGYYNTTGIARYVTTYLIMEKMREMDLSTLIHGATGRGNDQVRFQLCLNMLEPDFEVFAPWRDQPFLDFFGGGSRQAMIKFCDENGVPIKHSQEKPYSTDSNMLGLTHEAGVLEKLITPAHKVVPEMGVLATRAPDEACVFSVRFEKGFPKVVNGRSVTLTQAFYIANQIGGLSGIEICRSVVENRFVGIKSRGVYEAPGIALLSQCYEYLLQVVVDRRARPFFDQVSRFLGIQIYEGYWMDTASQMAMAAIEPISATATGTVAVSLYKGNVSFYSLKDVPYILYSEDDASMEAVGDFDHVDAEGFLKVLGLSARNLAACGQVNNFLKV